MAMIRVEHLTFSYPSSYDAVFEDVSFQIDTNWKLGFIGRNGRGKTTFLRLLLGQYEYAGRIDAPVSFDYFPYEAAGRDRPARAVLAEVCPGAQAWELERELSCLGVGQEALERPFGTLSPGEQTKALLAALFLKEGNFLLIDEPTNHLDAGARQRVAAYLKRKRGFILVSHDRQFLDGCVDHILALNRSGVEVQGGNYSTWAENFARRQASEQARNERLKKEIGVLQKSARRTAAWSDRVEGSKFGGGVADRGFVGHKAAKMMKRAKALEARQQRAAEEKSGLLKDLEIVEGLKLFPQPYFARTLAALREAAPVYGGRTVCAPVSFTVEQGDRIALEGGNGSGKSSLGKLLAGAGIAHTGTVTVGSGVVLSCVPQDAGFLRGDLREFAEQRQIDETLFKTILRKMGLERAQFEKGMEELSAGQKKKVLLAASLCQRAHLYLWDEPLNYLDIDCRRQIETLIREFAPAMVFVEHDGAFRDAVATRTVKVERG